LRQVVRQARGHHRDRGKLLLDDVFDVHIRLRIGRQDYADGLGAIIAGFKKEAGWDFPFFVAEATFAPGKGSYAPVRAGQKELWEKKIAVEGPDTDAMVGELRDQDGKGIHFSKKGLKVHGEAWAEKVVAYLDPG